MILQVQIISFLSILMICLSPFAYTEVVYDGTMINETKGKIADNYENESNVYYDIESNKGKLIDSNLYHSFSEFNINSNEIVTFWSPLSVKNIISRVTGNNPSYIKGVLNSFIEGTSDTYSDANIFLLNQSGIIFGPDAFINIGGSFFVSTADYLKMEDNNKFLSTPPIDSNEILTIANPLSFGFLKENTAKIEFNGVDKNSIVRINNGIDFNIVAGNINIKQIELSANQGNINLASVKTPKESFGEIDIRPLQSGWDTSNFSKLGNISILDNSHIDVSGNKAGNLVITSENFNIKNGCLIDARTANGNGGNFLINVKDCDIEASEINTSTYGKGDAANIIIEASGDVSFYGENIDSVTSLIYARSYYTSKNAGKGSDINISADNIFFKEGAGISGTTYGSGINGNITFNAKNLIQISGKSSIGRPSGIITTNKVGEINTQGGSLLFDARSIVLEDNARISLTTTGLTNGGDIHINAIDNVSCSNSQIYLQTQYNKSDAGDSGSLNIKAKNIYFNDGAEISASSFGTGHGGSVNLYATESINFDGENNDKKPSNISIQTLSKENDAGNSGNLTIDSPVLSFNHGSFISASTLGRGKGGNVIIKSEAIIFEGENSYGKTSNISLQTRPNNNDSYTTDEYGDSGSLLIESSSLLMKDGALISATTNTNGKGGDINIYADDSIIMSGESSNGKYRTQISLTTVNKAKVSEKTNKLFIESKNVSIEDGAYISSNTWGLGNAGEIEINASNMLNISGESKDGVGSNITASVSPESNGGSGGTIKINAGDIILDGGGVISTNTYSIGKGGDVLLDASGTLLIKGTSSVQGVISSINSVSSNKFCTNESISGDGGRIDISANNLIIKDGGQINTSTLSTYAKEQVSSKNINLLSSADEIKSGNAGELNIYVKNMTELSGVNMFGENEDGLGSGLYARSKEIAGSAGDAGTINLETGSLIIKDGAVISSSTTGLSKGGNVDIKINGALEISGFALHPDLENSKESQHDYQNSLGDEFIPKTSYSGIFASSESDSKDSGHGGTVDISALDAKIDNYGSISTSSSGGGDAGDINLNLASLKIDNSGKISSASSKGTEEVYNEETKKIEKIAVGGAAGTITIETDDYIRLTNKSSLTTEAVNTRQLEQTDENHEKDKNNGKITLNTKNMLYLQNSEITSSVQGGLGNGGDIDIDPEFVIMNNSKIIANAYAGNGGNIHIVAGQFVQSTSSTVEASSEFGLDGSIDIEAPDVDISSGLAILPDSFLDATKWINNSCQLNNKKTSSLIIKDKDGAALRFDDWLP